MDRWQGRLAVVTGASSGIGAVIAAELIKNGMIVVGIARSSQKIEKLKEKLPENLRSNLHAMECDVSNEEEIISTFQEIDQTYGPIATLINCASSFKYGNLLDKENTQNLRNIIDVNLFGTVFCTREAYHYMRRRKVEDGHIININSYLGHHVPYVPNAHAESSWNMFPASKHAVIAFNEILRQELAHLKSNIKITSISSGLTGTKSLNKLTKNIFKYYENDLKPVDVARSVLYALSTPPRVQIEEVIVRLIREPV